MRDPGTAKNLNRVASAKRREHGLLVIVREARHLIHLIDNALTFAGAGRSAVGLSRQNQVLAPLVEEVIEAVVPQLKAQGSRLESNLDPDVRAEVDSTAIRQLVRNLLDNALRHGKAGQTLRVELVHRDGSAEITIDDGGPGIPAAHRARAFRPFVRLSAQTTGSGLGLAIVKHLLDLHGGTVNKEFDLLAALLRRRGQAVSRKDLLHDVWGYADGIESRTVDWHVAELRRKLETDPAEPRLLVTVRKVGYRLA